MIAVISVPRWGLPSFGWPDNGLLEAGDNQACLEVTILSASDVTTNVEGGCDG